MCVPNVSLAWTMHSWHQTQGNADPALKPGFHIFSTQMKVFLPFEGHTMAYQCKGLDQSNIVCEYEVNLWSYYRNPKLLMQNDNVVKEQC